MSNKHGQGPRCPMCPRTFRDERALRDHQRTKFHFADVRRPSDEDLALAKLRAYHQDKIGSGQ